MCGFFHVIVAQFKGKYTANRFIVSALQELSRNKADNFKTDPERFRDPAEIR